VPISAAPGVTRDCGSDGGSKYFSLRNTLK